MLKQIHKINLFDIGAVTLTFMFGVLCFYPMWYVFIASITPWDRYLDNTFKIFPVFPPTLEYYKYIFISGTKMFTRAMFISFSKTVLGSFGALFITSMMAYAVSKKHIKGMKMINFIMVFTLFFGGGLIPYYLLIKDLRLLNTFAAMVVPLLLNIGHFIIMRNYFSYSVPPSLEDAALIDGANEVNMFFKIIIPISMPMLAAIFLFEAVYHWNDYYSYLILVSEATLQPFVWILRRILIDTDRMFSTTDVTSLMQDRYVPPEGIKMATIIVAMLPIIILYPFLQKHFAKGILIGAVKE